MSHITTAHPPIARQASGTRRLTDAEFVAAFESCTLAPHAFRHYDHVRLAWTYLRTLTLPEATNRMAASIRRFALHHTGTTAKYDDTLTRAWMRLVAHVREISADAPDFATFAEANPMLLDRRRAFDHYGVAAP
ncbi:MAG TPA: hypothetical protein VFZ21_27495 [Gemmatimonadaceae bacterium]|jgi:hypothetical protein|nr:hypothetical protein [Gemmatimonadaceae bacterium]